MTFNKEATLELENDILVEVYVRHSYDKENVNEDCISIINCHSNRIAMLNFI